MSAISLEWGNLFGKCFDLTLPSKDVRCKDEEESCKDKEISKPFYDSFVRRIEELKDELNFTKSRLNDFDIKIWRTHTNFMNLCGHLSRHCKTVLNAELCTQAWLKFCTILNTFELVKRDQGCLEGKFSSVHLCEAPGAFVTCLNHHIVNKFPDLSLSWRATTFNPYYEGNNIGEMITDDRLIKKTLNNWHFGEDFTGDLASLKNLEHLKDACEKSKSVNLVTADGSIDCSEKPDMQEALVSYLLYWEFVTAINIISTGGNFVIKAFTVLEEFTISMVFLLCTAFEQVHFCKPGPSKPGNSEVYIVCIAFRGLDVLGKDFYNTVMQRTTSSDFTSSLIPLRNIPERFLSKLLECEEYFIRLQIQAIQSNISAYKSLSEKAGRNRRRFIKEQKDAMCRMFVNNFDLQALDQEKAVTFAEGAPPDLLSHPKEHSHNFSSGNFYERSQKKYSTWLDRIDQKDCCGESFASHVFSEAVNDIAEVEVAEWFPIVGKKFSKLKSTQFGSNYLLKDLLEARELCKLEDFAIKVDVDMAATRAWFTDDAVLKEAVIQLGGYKQPTALNVCYEENVKITLDAVQLASTTSDACSSAASSSCDKGEAFQGSEQSLDLLNAALRLVAESTGWERPSFDLLFCCAVGMSDDVYGSETCRETFCSIAFIVLSLLEEGGALICRIGDVFTNFNAGIVYILIRQFCHVSIIKPDSWCASRLLICRGLKKRNALTVGYIKKLLLSKIEILEGKCQDNDIIHVVPISCILEEKFTDFLQAANESFSKYQLNVIRNTRFKKTELR